MSFSEIGQEGDCGDVVFEIGLLVVAALARAQTPYTGREGNTIDARSSATPANADVGKMPGTSRANAALLLVR